MKKIILILFAVAVLLASVYADFQISNPIPSNNSVLPSGTTSTTLSVETDINATCRYWNTSGQDFSSMTLFTNTDEINHNSTITGLQDAQGYDYYVKCQNADNASDITDDYQIHFFILDYALEYCFTDQLGYWTFDNFIDDILYDILGINYGTIYGDVTTNPCVVGDGFNFDGVDSYIDVAGDIDLADSTIGFWITPDQDYGLGSGQTKNITIFKDDDDEIFIGPEGRIKKKHNGEIIAESPPNIWKIGKSRFITVNPETIYLGSRLGCFVSELLHFFNANPEEVDQGSSVNLAIESGCPPFSWTVSGGGFSLEEGINGEMILSANGSACGSAEITVTDDLGQSITTYVRSTVGQWSSYTNGCVLSGAPDSEVAGAITLVVEKTQGKYNQKEVVTESGSGDNCNIFCNNPTYGCIGCTPCLSWHCTSKGWYDCGGSFSCGVWGCGEDDGTWCMCQVGLAYREWECAP